MLGFSFVAASCCALAAGIAGAQESSRFEHTTIGETAPADWQTEGAVALDRSVTRGGSASVRIEQPDPNGTGRALGRMAARDVAGDRGRLSGYLRTAAVASGAASLWLRIDGPNGLLYFDGMRDRGAAGTTDWTRYEVEAPLFPEATEITYGAMLRGSGTAWVHDLELTAVHTADLPPPSAAAKRYLEEALVVMREHSLVRASTDWPALTAAALAQARGAATPADAHLAVSYALRRLGDDHSYLASSGQSRALLEAPVVNARTGRRAVEPRGEQLPGGIGYLWVPGFAGGRPEHQVAFGNRLQASIRELDAAGSCGWILDLRDNRGGNLWPMLIGVGPLLGEGVLGASHFPDGSVTALSYVNGQARYGEYTQLRVSAEPYRLRRTEPPIAVLLGRATASSAEVLAAGFRGMRNARSFGTPTSGVSTGTRIFELSDGAALVLAVAATSDRTGRVLNGPITPDEEVREERGARDAPLVEQPVVRAALEWLGAEPACRSAAGQELDSF